MYPKVDTKPEVIITTIFINFRKSLTNNARKVRGTAKLKPSFSGMASPKMIPKNVIPAHDGLTINL